VRVASPEELLAEGAQCAASGEEAEQCPAAVFHPTNDSTATIGSRRVGSMAELLQPGGKERLHGCLSRQRDSTVSTAASLRHEVVDLSVARHHGTVRPERAPATHELDKDVGRSDRWAPEYDRDRLQRRFFGPVHAQTLALAAGLEVQPRRVLDIGCGTGTLLRQLAGQFPGRHWPAWTPRPA
jgi:hypothetical protein